MQKLNTAIQQATTELKISQSQLSARLGKSRNYLSEMKRVGCTTDKQNEIIDMINQVLKGEVFKSDDAIIAELSEKLAHSQDLVQHNADCAHKYLKMVHDADEKIGKLKVIVNDTDESYGALNSAYTKKQILLNQSEENTLYWISKVPSTRWQAFKLFVKLMFGGKA